jgi:antitoxin MazE
MAARRRRDREADDYLTVATRMQATLVRIGNARGIRLPKALIDEAGLTNEVDNHAEPGKIVVTPVEPTRKGWAGEAGIPVARSALPLTPESVSESSPCGHPPLLR